MVEKNRPANISFAEDETGSGGDFAGPARISLAAIGSRTEPDFMDSVGLDDLDSRFEDESIASVASPHKRKGKPGMPTWMLALAAFMLLAVLGGAYLSFSVFKKRSESYTQQNEVIPQSVPQPVITPVVTLSERTLVARPPEQAQEAVTNTTVVNPAEQPLATVANGIQSSTQPHDGAAASVVDASEIKKLKDQLDLLASRIVTLENEKLAMRKAAAEVAAKVAQQPRQATPPPTVTVKPVVKPVSQPAPVKPAPVQKQKPVPPREEVALSYKRDFTISAIVNNRAFVIKKMPDGSEQEISVVVGDKIDGKSVELVDGQSKEVRLEGNQRITTGRAR
jgi:hypothetical protein